MPSAAARFCVSADSRTFFIASEILATTAGGVPAGANTPTQASSSKPGRPASATVGTLGSEGCRALLVTAYALSLPLCTWPITDGGVVMKTCTWPPSTSWIAAPDPL